MKNALKELLKIAIKPTQAKYTLLHDGQRSTRAIKGIDYKIICESPAKPSPLTVEQVLNLDNEQAAQLVEFLELRRRKRLLIKADLNYQNFFNRINLSQK
ncbi:hypothetical protein [Flavobacterium sandaracinum]|uniref:Uncharacterized protein n=1 Tax=Flavobacterium sandaracinum TaxID=2541733 RepID=A0A4R5CT10_9FLAO|nr:hypothetical protein [Flavobacterium sandaracinum]TDE02727.1 hypothetical protein E0F91_12000 [Flavobacterium sandaracinum]